MKLVTITNPEIEWEEYITLSRDPRIQSSRWDHDRTYFTLLLTDEELAEFKEKIVGDYRVEDPGWVLYTDAWHYRWLSRLLSKYTLEEYDFCQYWRAFGLSVFFSIFMLAFFWLLGGAFVASVFDTSKSVSLVLSPVAWLVFAGIVWAGMKAVTHIMVWLDSRPAKPPKSKKPSAVKQYIAAKKEKYCPKLYRRRQ